MSYETLFSKYFKKVAEVVLQGDAREESFYSVLADMLAEVARETGRKHIRITTLPKSTDAGNPDFRLWNGSNRIVGYVEAKNPSEHRLDLIEESEQLERYRSTFPNLILTNFFEFRLYRNGQCVDSVIAARPMVAQRLRTVPPVEKGAELYALLERFLDFSLPRSFSAESLAIELAKRTRFLRDIVADRLRDERSAPGMLTGFYEAFQKYLIGDLTPADFADLYAQTISYGLFAARSRAGENFTRKAAFDNIPHTIGVLRDLFRFISLGDFPEQLAWSVDDIAEVLAVADAPGILERYYRQGKGSDPIVHFYETFLAQYDPEERERRGVYYTPEPVVSYIVRSLHVLLKREFRKPDGLASVGVTLLDPAAGTMTFVARATQEAVHEFEVKYGAGGREEFIRRHILHNFYAFELMMAPYAVGHLKMGFFLEELGHRLSNDERVPFYLTNALDTEELEQSRLPGFSSLAEESRIAANVKKQTPVLVILGNPPYSGISANMGSWITGLIEDYKYVDGKHFGEKKHWLQDDYVKFLRFAQWKIEQTGCGVVGMITNHGYLDNPTFRGMRQSIMRTFDAVYVLDLHGNTLKREITPDGSKDENVFDIRQGVAVAFFVKRGAKTTESAKVWHSERWGLRSLKYEWLESCDVESTDWKLLAPDPPFYFFVPFDDTGNSRFRSFVGIPEVFPIGVTGIVTARDRFVFDFDRSALLRRIGQFRDRNLSDEFIRRSYSLKDTRGWKLPDKRKKLEKLSEWRDHALPCLYRPFDIRWLYYHPDMVDWGRPEVMRHMTQGENIALVVPKQHKDEFGAFVTDAIGAHKSVAAYDINYYFPLYLYPDSHGQGLFSHERSTEQQPNLNPKLAAALKHSYGKKPSPEDILHYIYAILYSPKYRELYAEFLRTDFPRIPFPSDKALFKKLSALGARLTELHLLRSSELDPPACRFEGKGNNCIGKGQRLGTHYDLSSQRVYINASQYFGPVPRDAWEYQVGGYQVCEKWLRDRQDRRLDLDEIRTYCRIVTALELTISIQQEIDALYSGAEGQTITFSDEQTARSPRRETVDPRERRRTPNVS